MSLLPYAVARPFLFGMNPEAAHELALHTIAKLQHSPLTCLYRERRVDDPVTVAGLRFPNRVGLAAGLDKNARCIDGLAAMGFGFVEVGTVTPKGQPGNPKPRMFRLPQAHALINRLGFNNEGLDAFVANVQRARFRNSPTAGQPAMLLGLNVGKNASTPIERATDDYLTCLDGVYPHADYVTVNISSPNTQNLRSLQSDAALDALLGAVAERREQLVQQSGRRIPIFLKIAPDLDDAQIEVIAATLLRYGAASDGTANNAFGVMATNTTLSRQAVGGMPHAEEVGGLSGAPVLHASNQVIRRLRAGLGNSFPIVGVGGILSGEDAVSKIQAGADVVQIYTGLIYKGPALVRESALAIQAHAQRDDAPNGAKRNCHASATERPVKSWLFDTNSPRKSSMSLFSAVEMAPRDPILGLNEQFAADTNPNKVNLGVGVYFDDNGKLPLLQCVQAAEKTMMATPSARGYLPIDGIAAYDAAVKSLVFGADSEPVQSGRVATVQAIGGTGGLKIGADFLKRLSPNAKVLISDPSWENHRALFINAGFVVDTYAYYDAAKRGVNFEGMLASLNAAEPGTVVVLHACCHNPTGYDINPAQWDQVIATVKARGLTPFLDMAYQGFGHGIAEDGAVIGKFVAAGLTFFVSTSFSKSFSLYGERVGALSVLCESKEEAGRVLSQLKIVIRTNYSNPPIHGGAVVAAVLNNPELRALWEKELGEMRVRIKAMRQKLVDGLKAAGVKQDMSFITSQIGMFSYSGLNKDQMVRLRSEFGVYGTDTGRMCVAALNSKNIDYVCQAVAKVA